MSQNEPEVEVAIGRDDWERFISSIERLMSLHEQTLQRLKELGRRNEALRGELRDAMGLRSLDLDSTRGGASRLNGRLSFLERLVGSRQTQGSSKSRFEQAASAPIAAGLATCGKCGFQITKPSRFCERCGVHFGVLVCRCGRELGQDDKFCDSCGQKVLG